jgi:hypothetical protein
MAQPSNFEHASAIASALGATLTPLNPETATHETYVLGLKENRRARLSLQFGRARRPDQLFFDTMFPGDVMRAGVRISRNYRVATEMNESDCAGEMVAPISGSAVQIAADLERHVIQGYLRVLERVVVFFPETAPVAVAVVEKGSKDPLMGQLAM